jgi:hypothetical protein
MLCADRGIIEPNKRTACHADAMQILLFCMANSHSVGHKRKYWFFGAPEEIRTPHWSRALTSPTITCYHGPCNATASHHFSVHSFCLFDPDNLFRLNQNVQP